LWTFDFVDFPRDPSAWSEFIDGWGKDVASCVAIHVKADNPKFSELAPA
jgi:hypothetical protein